MDREDLRLSSEIDNAYVIARVLSGLGAPLAQVIPAGPVERVIIDDRTVTLSKTKRQVCSAPVYDPIRDEVPGRRIALTAFYASLHR